MIFNKNEKNMFLAFCEGETLDDKSLSELGDLKEELKKMPNGCFQYTGDNLHFSACGFFTLADCPIIIFPKNFPLKENSSAKEVKDNAKLLLQIFARYRINKSNSAGWKKRPLSDAIDDQDGNVITRINDILYILDDFKRNGYLLRRHDVISPTRPGRVMWNRTMHRVTPLINHHQVIYPNPYMKSRVHYDEEMVQKIHRYLVKKFRNQWGWLVGMERKKTIPKPPCSPVEAEKYIVTELRSCFVQREIDLLRRMLRYYRKKIGKDTEPRDEYMLTTEFEYIWQDVCGIVFGNMYDEYKGQVPKAPFVPSLKNYKNFSWRQKPDILCRKNNKFYVLDAKYYPLKADELPDVIGDDNRKIYNVPGWADIVKQFVYFYSMKKRLENEGNNESVERNLLLFPNDTTELAGKAILEDVGEFGEIEFWWLDIKKMFSAYVFDYKYDIENLPELK